MQVLRVPTVGGLQVGLRGLRGGSRCVAGRGGPSGRTAQFSRGASGQSRLFGDFPAAPQFDTHDELVAALEALEGDPLEREGGRIVVYRGDPSAHLMVVGEGPGAEEDRLGKPYVGRSGQLLDKILGSVLLDPERDIYVTNVVKRRPANNRDPTRAEVEYYLPWLEEEIRLVDPKVVMLTGKFAMVGLLGEKKGITKVRGTWYEAYGREMMPVYHPAYLLRNPQRTEGSPKAQMWQDVREIRRRLDELCA